MCGFLVPDDLLGLCITPACDIHDYMYTVGDSISDKDSADRSFLNNMLRLIDAHDCWQIFKRRRALEAQVYYEAVHLFGGPAFWSGKNLEVELGIVTSNPPVNPT